MSSRVSVDLNSLVKPLGIALPQLAKVVELLDAGNTVPFITRYRKDQTGGLDEEQIRQVQSRIGQARLLAERQQTILRSIEAQGKLTPELAAAILGAHSAKRLEDLYLPYKPKKRTLATLARERGLELLAREILSADPVCADLTARAADYVNPDRQVKTPAEALLGAGHILAEQFSERADLRQQLRQIVERTGKLVTSKAETEAKPPAGSEPSPHAAVAVVDEPAMVESDAGVEHSQPEASHLPASELDSAAQPGAGEHSDLADDTLQATDSATADSDTSCVATTLPAGEIDSADEPELSSAAASVPAPAVAATTAKPAPPRRKQGKPVVKLDDLEQRFRDYFNYQESLRRIPPHRVLAINRGERARVLRVRVEVDQDALEQATDRILVPEDHPHADLLRGCACDALNRLVLPGLERELRRELTDAAEAHAVEVFARNLRHLLLQPPVRGRRVLAIDPGFRSGCKVAALDEFGSPLAHAVIHIIGKDDRRQASRAKLLELAEKHHPTVIAFGNGTGCRQSEELVADLLQNEWKDQGLAYVIVNEAGASVYSTSPLGREELPGHDATLRGTISIGRRLQDPLSELVKIDPPSIGVGLYQHDVKAKHLRTSLDAVIESCVNFVGVNVNTASPALLRYVSGLNQLTARRLYDHRVGHGPFRNRTRFMEVAGLGEAAFTQAAGFLRIVDGDDPLDATTIHPESYAVARMLWSHLGFQPEDLANPELRAQSAERAATVDAAALANQWQVGELTLRDILAQLARPGRDPREDLPQPVFKRGILKLEDLTVGMELSGTVLNVVDFGVFVDIGLNDSGLVHISQLADRFIQSPHEVAAVGDIVTVWVLSIDKERRRVSLTMIDPARAKLAEERKARQQPPPRRPAQQSAEGQAPPTTGRPAAGAGDRPPRPNSGQSRPGPGQTRQGSRQTAGQGSRQTAGQGQGRGSNQGQQGNRSGRGGNRVHGGRPAPPRPNIDAEVAERLARKRPPVVVKLTKAMEQGKAPVRTFGELKKLLELKQQPADAPAPQVSPPAPQPPAPDDPAS